MGPPLGSPARVLSANGETELVITRTWPSDVQGLAPFSVFKVRVIVFIVKVTPFLTLKHTLTLITIIINLKTINKRKIYDFT